MLDFSQVTNFGRRLLDASETSDLEKDWKQEASKDLAKTINPPRATGALAASVRATEEGVSMFDYWQFPEYGTVHMAPQPFVRPAISRQAPESAKDIGDMVIRELT